MMWRNGITMFLVQIICTFLCISISAQTNTVSSGNWNDGANWDSGVPATSDVANVNHDMTVDSDITCEGNYTLNSNVTDASGGSAYKIEVQSSANFIVNADVTFEGDFIASNNAVITVSGCGTFTVGNAEFQNNAIIIVESCATLVINGNLLMKNNLGMTIDGHVIINGDVSAENNTIISGDGGMSATGTIDVSGSAEIFGATDPCTSAPCGFGSPLVTNVISIASGNWSNTATWDCTCVPDSTHNVTIDTVHSITLDGDQKSSDLIVRGTFASSGAFTIDIGNNWTNTGTYTSGTETLRFTGGGGQTISGNSSQTFSNITVADGSDLTHSLSSITLTGNLLFESGSFSSGNVMVLRSDGSGTANIGDLTNGTFTGNVILERMVPAGATGWRFLSSGLSGQTISGWNDDFITAGFLGSDFPTFSFTSIYTYNEATAGVRDSGFVAATSIADNLGAGNGFWVWSGDNSSGTAAFTIDLVGAINQGSIGLPVTYTNNGLPSDDGWNVVGNPYPCAIDWDSKSWTKTNIDDAIYIWNPNSASYTSYVGGVGNNGGSNVIASSQAFWVKANAAGPNLTAVESVKSTSLADPFKAFVPNQLVRIVVTPGDSSSRDETTISFNPNATENFEGYADALKLGGVLGGVYISTNLPDDQKLSINSLSLDTDIEIPIFVQVQDSGQYKFEFLDLGGVDAAACIHIRDEATNSTTAFVGDMSFSSNVDVTSAPYHKFTLVVSVNNKVEITEPSCAQVNDGEVIVTNPGTGPWGYNFWSPEDSLFTHNSSSNSSNEIIYKDLSPGTYVVEVSNNSICPTRSNEITIPEVDSTIALFNPDLAGIVLIDDYEFSFLNESLNADSFTWSFGDGGKSEDADPFYYYSTPGEYEIVLTATKNGVCEHTTTKKILVLDVAFEESNDPLSAHVFPNPVHSGEDILLHFNKYIEDVSVQIYNIKGKLVSNHFDYIKSTYTSLNVGDIPVGIYIVRVLSEDSAVFIKLVVE